MTKQVKNLKHLQSEIHSALSLIAHKSTSLENIGVPKRGLIAGTESLLERCENVVNRNKDQKPVLRVIHHLACSGGTIFSKCIAAMPNVFLLSEAHPFSPFIPINNPEFSPTDIPSLARFAKVPNIERLSEELFRENIKKLNEHVSKNGGQLVVRYHSHSDYNTSNEIPENNRFLEIMSEYFYIKQVLTIRDPIDAYSSLKKNGWVHFEPQNFDEYCRRYLIHLSHFDEKEIFRYEDFVDNPFETLKAVCPRLNLSFDESFEYTLGLGKLTGDSGRNSEKIEKRSRIASDSVIGAANKSPHYQAICESCRY